MIQWIGRIARVRALRAGLVIAAVNLVILLVSSVALQTLAALTLAGLLPGWLLFDAILDDSDLDALERITLAAGLGYTSIILGMLLLHYWPGPLTRWLVLLWYDALMIALLVLGFLRQKRSASHPWNLDRRALPPLLVLATVSLLFRFPNLGYAEFQGDEVAVLQKAADSIQGRDDALFFHKKGPAEILIPTSVYSLTRRMNEWSGRFPFALANVLGVLSLYALGRRFLSPRAGWWAALLISLCGFYVAFGRIVQYQSLVFLFGVLGLFCALLFTDALDRRYLWLCGTFLALGLLAHSDALFGAVAAIMVLVKCLVGRRVSLREAMRWLVGPTILAGSVLAVFYVPFALHPHFSVMQEYLKFRQGQPPYNNLAAFLDIGTVYSAVYYLGFVALALLALGLRHLSRITRWRWLLPSLALALLGSSWLFPGLWHIGERDLTGGPYVVLLVALLFVSGSSITWKAALVWFALPSVAYLFWFRDPRTHFYMVFPGALLLVGAELDQVAERLGKWKWLVGGSMTLLLGISTAYLYIAFIDHTPEYKRTYPAHRLRLFWVPYGDKMPEQGLFGFPYQVGWKVVGDLYASGALQGDYSTNEETHITGWYTRGQPTCENQPRYYFLAESVQDAQYVPKHEVEADYDLVGQVWVGDQVKLRLYERNPAHLAYSDYSAAEFASSFDRDQTDPVYATGLKPLDPLEVIQHAALWRVGQDIEFLGHSLDRQDVGPGQALNLTLYWRALSEVADSYTVFTHVEDPGVVWGQRDAVPCCARCPTDEWEVQRVYVDRYTIVLNSTTPPGAHGLVAGMYRVDTGERLPVADAMGNPAGDLLDLGTINVVVP